MNKIIFILLLCFSTSFALITDVNKEEKKEVKKIEQELIKEKFEQEHQKQEEQRKLKEEQEEKERKQNEINKKKQIEINEILIKIKNIQNKLKDNILLKRYLNYLSYSKISSELTRIRETLRNKKDITEEEAFQLSNKIRVKTNELELIQEYKGSPIGGFINPPEMPKYDKITNPFGIINSLSIIRKLEDNKKQFKNITQDVNMVSNALNDELFLYLEVFNLSPQSDYKEVIKYLDKQKKDFDMVLEIVTTTEEVYTRKTDQIILEIKDQISQQIQKISLIVSVILILFLINFIIKLVLKKYFSQNESYYMTNKILNFTIIFTVIMILLFSYIDNVSYLVTILGFASAGIAIALRDWFMSIFGWMVIVTSGSIQVGDRIKVSRNGLQAVGDVLDISLFKITIREDITYTSYKVNRRTGRIFFIPNNYIFSETIANYTHSGLRTVWDGIDITLTFDSNHKKAQRIVKDILKHYSKGYTDITRKQLSKMRSKYQLRATGVEPRVFTFLEEHGMVISGWYLTNSYAALQLRSTMSPEILDAFMKEDDIHIAYPTTQININKTQNAYGPSRERQAVQKELEDAIITR